ncbi:MAG TPA: hypothetical protein VJ964_03225 [Balneolaceae bacterium]|nr:hypothetical protein [Balneolaceae bacterium]
MPPQRDSGSQAKYESPKNENPTSNDYPASWDNIELTEGSQEYIEATRHAVNDADEYELEELCRKDPTVKKLVELFDCEMIMSTN